jgi:hypothetical protein
MKTMFERFKVATAVTLALAVAMSLAVTQPASARDGRNAALLGGLAAGALLGGVIANNRGGYYEDEPASAPVYRRPPPVMAYDYDEEPAPRCYVTRQPVYDEDGEFAGYRRARVCD